jgi:hypothetical protein
MNNPTIDMNSRIGGIKLAALAAALLLGAIGGLPCRAADTNATTVAYWQFGGTVTDANSPSGASIADLGVNFGQGSLTNALPNLWILGPLNGSPTFSSATPPTSLLNSNTTLTGGSGSWDVGADEYAGVGGEIDCDNIAYGDIFDTPSFTEEVIFKTDYANDPDIGTVKQTLVWNHQNSAYCHLQLNESASGNTNDIGSLLFWSWNVQAFTTVRVTAAQNGGQRLDDGHWHYAAARYDGAALTMDLLVVNEDGSSAESITYIGAPLNPGGSGSQGPLIIGNDEGGATPLDGLINQVRFSSAALPNDKLLAKATGCNAPAFAGAAPSTNAVAVGAALNFSPAYWPVQMEGGPLQFQWQSNGENIPGQTNISINLFPATLASAGSYQLVASNICGSVATSAPVTVQVSQAINLARWGFNYTEATTFPQATVDDLEPAFSNVYDLITFNNQPNVSGIGGNGEIPLTNDVPPTAMFINGNNGGTNAFDPSYLAGQDGVVFYPAGPDVFDFQGSFSLELFFRSYGDQSQNGTMALICQGTDGGNAVRYSVNLNQAGPGAVNFHVNNYAVPPLGPSYEDTNAGIQTVALTNANYADGNWHYLLAQYDSGANKITLQVANSDATSSSATEALPVGYSPLPSRFEGNSFVGRYRYPWTDDNRNFMGEIDEVQVSSGLVTPSAGQLGYLPGAPTITGIIVSGGAVTIEFAGNPSAAASSYAVVGSPTVAGTYSAQTATVVSLGAGNFQATLTPSSSTEFYRIKQ